MLTLWSAVVLNRKERIFNINSMVQFFVLIILNFRSLPVIICTTYCNIKMLCTFTALCVNVFGTLLKLSSYYFQKEHQQVGHFFSFLFSFNFRSLLVIIYTTYVTVKKTLSSPHCTHRCLFESE